MCFRKPRTRSLPENNIKQPTTTDTAMLIIYDSAHISFNTRCGIITWTNDTHFHSYYSYHRDQRIVCGAKLSAIMRGFMHICFQIYRVYIVIWYFSVKSSLNELSGVRLIVDFDLCTRETLDSVSGLAIRFGHFPIWLSVGLAISVIFAMWIKLQLN